MGYPKKTFSPSLEKVSKRWHNGNLWPIVRKHARASYDFVCAHANYEAALYIEKC
jgi:hypothetical protein